MTFGRVAKIKRGQRPRQTVTDDASLGGQGEYPMDEVVLRADVALLDTPQFTAPGFVPN
jgi:hypothetical protein